MSPLRTLFYLALASATLDAAGAAPPNLTPPQLLPGDVAIGGAAGDQEQPSMAFGGGQYLAAWTDWRADRSGTLGLDQSGSDIYAARLTADGTPIDVAPILLDQSAAFQEEPRVAWNGSNWLVTWQSQEPTQFFWAASILGVRVSPQGQVLDPAPIHILTYQFSSTVTHTLIAAGGEWLVIGQGTSSGESNVIGRRVSAQGALIDATPKTLLSPTSLIFNPSLAASQGTFLLGWSDAGAVRARRFDAALNPIWGQITLASFGSGVSGVDVAGHDGGFFVAFSRYISSNQLGTVYGARVTTGGVVQDPGGVTIAQASLLSQPSTGVTWDGTNWLVSWRPNSFLSNLGLLVSRITTQGQNLDPGGVSVKPSPNTEFDEPRLIGKTTGGAQVIWTDRRAGGPFPADVYSAEVNGQLVPGAEHLVSTGAPRQTGADVVWNGAEYLVVFKSETSGFQRVLGQRVSAAGVAIDAQPVEIVAPQNALLGAPRVDWNGSHYLLAYAQQGKLFTIRFDAGLNLLDPAPFEVMNIDSLEVDVAALGADFLIAGLDNPTQEHVRSVFGRRVASDGTFLDASRFVMGASFAVEVRVVEHGGQWLVVYRRNSTHDNPFGQVYATRVTSGGAAAPTFVVRTPATSGLGGVDVATGNGVALITWSEPVGEGDIYANRMTPTGALLDGAFGFPVVSGPGAQFGADVAFNGVDFGVVHEDRRAITFFLDQRSDVYAGRVDGSGVALDPAGFAVHDAVAPEVEPAVAGAGGATLTVTSVFRDDAPYTAYRLTLRRYDDCPGGAVSHGAGCAGSGGVTPTLSLTGCPSPGESGQLTIAGGLGGATALLFFGLGPVNLPMGGGCQLLVAPLLPLVLTPTLSSGGPGAGAVTIPFTVPGNTPPVQVGLQAFVPDGASAIGASNTNGLILTIQ